MFQRTVKVIAVIKDDLLHAVKEINVYLISKDFKNLREYSIYIHTVVKSLTCL